ncbi:UNVERIFIED_CONTAM: hypothetical protein Sangu_3164500 [Sesamum angustifolium]|uniref:Endonuclease/exonuclease/phosphatase domain-containing protein n=1 Tax=Sesamum angustifolium TaxID=2727405 RepID=A0AAW2JU71_9LAMI
MSLRRQKHIQIPVWIRLKHLPMEYWTEEGLSTVASGVGTPLYTDGITRECSRLDFARSAQSASVQPILGELEAGVFKSKAATASSSSSAQPAQFDILGEGQPGKIDDSRGKKLVLHNSFNALDDEHDDAAMNSDEDNRLPGPNICSPQCGNTEGGNSNIHCRAYNKRLHTRCLISVLYGDYDLIPRRDLWSTLRTLSIEIGDEPWLVLGDFNAVIDDSEVRGRAADTSASMAEFRSCILDTGLVHLPFTGNSFTWHNCSEGTRSLWKRLDRMLVNEAWLVLGLVLLI